MRSGTCPGYSNLGLLRGGDANPCSYTGPCKTYAGAISKTAAGGEISALDPGRLWHSAITKAMTINGDGDLASTTSFGTTGDDRRGRRGPTL